MTQPAARRDDLLAAIRGALDLVRQESPGLPAPPASAAPLGSLLDQCRAFRDEAATAPAEPVRTLHHMACTGGTLISKCLAVMPNTRLMSEIAPLSRLGLDPAKPRFLPGDLLYHLKTGLRPADDALLTETFLAGLAVILRHCRQRGEYLVLRDHAHSQFCNGPEIGTQPTLDRMVAAIAPVRAAVTVRHPMASYLSLLKNGWEHYSPQGIGEYARRYLAFLEAHDGLPVFRYEDIVAAPDTGLRALCAALELPWSADAETLFPMVRLSGDSGRSGAMIAPRAPKAPPAELEKAAEDSETYRILCNRLGYPLREAAEAAAEAGL